MKDIFHQHIPSYIGNILRRYIPGLKRSRMTISGNYYSWTAAQADSLGYDSEIILEKTKKSLLKVKNGEAIYERDSVLFNEIQYSWSVLAGLMWVAAQSRGHLNVLDFGGSLGSTYYQNRKFFQDLPEVRWNIVEQAAHVQVGKEFFENSQLKFYEDIDSCFSETRPNTILLSSVLQYVEYPYNLLENILTIPDIEFVIIDRTSFWHGPNDWLCVQEVPATIYPASYPIWVFSERNFLQAIKSRNFTIVTEFQSLDHLRSSMNAVWKGMILKRDHDIKEI